MSSTSNSGSKGEAAGGEQGRCYRGTAVELTSDVGGH